MKITKTVLAKELKAGDEIQLRKGVYHGLVLRRVITSPRGKILPITDKYGNNPITHTALPPDQKVTILIEGDPSPTVGLYEI